MLQTARQLESLELRARDGRVGHVVDLFFDDRRWALRYFVVDTGSWLNHREVLIAPAAVHAPDWDRRVLPVDLTTEQVRGSPPMTPDEILTREQELALIQYYNWPMYWGAPGFSDSLMYAVPPAVPNFELAGQGERVRRGAEALDQQHHIRSIVDVRGHHLVATDGEIGHIEDFVIDDSTWEIEGLVVVTRNWLPGRRVLIAPEWIYEVGWDAAKVYVDLSREQIRSSPPYEGNAPLAADYVDRLHMHYRPHRREEP